MESPIPTTTDEAATTWYNTVFIDTSLNTHLALIVSDSDTVSDLKNRIVVEHALCFPGIGKINVHALKVKRRGYFYHLSESMYVKSAFHGFNKSWFISVDVSTVKDGIDADKSCQVSLPVNEVVAQVGIFDDGGESKRLLKGCSSSLHQDKNGGQLVLGGDGLDGSGKHASGEFSAVGSHNRKKEKENIEKDKVQEVCDEGVKGNLENAIVIVQDILLEGAEDPRPGKKRKHISKKKSQNAVDEHPVENTIRECSTKGAELFQDEVMREGNNNIADEHCTKEVSNANKMSDGLFERFDGPPGGSSEYIDNLSNIKAVELAVEDSSHSQLAEKKRKHEKKRGDENSVEVDRALIPHQEKTLAHQNENNQQSFLGNDRLDGPGKNMSGEIDTTDSQKRKNGDQDIEKDEACQTEHEAKEGNLENDTGHVQGKVVEERAQETGSDQKKNRKTKKKHRIAVDDLPLDNTAQECSKSGAELCKDEHVFKGNEGIADGDRTNMSEDKADGLDADMGVASHSQPAAKKRHKREKQKGDDNSVIEGRTVDPDYKKETPRHPTNIGSLMEEKNKKSAHSPTEKMENAHIQSALPSGRKRKGKTRSTKEEISSATDFKSEDFRAIKEMSSKDLDGETNAASVPENYVEGLPSSDPYDGKGRLSDAVQESNVKPSTQGPNTNDIDLGNAKSGPNIPEQETSYSSGGIKSLKNDDAVSAGLLPDALTQDPKDKDEYAIASGDENIIQNKEEKERTPNICPSIVEAEKSKLVVAEEECIESKEAKSKLAEISELGDGKRSSKRRKKAKSSQDLENGVSSAREPIEGSISGVSLIEAPKSVGIVAEGKSNKQSKKRKGISEVEAGSTSVLATDREIIDVIQNVVESVNKITETFVETENVDRTSRKKSKKKQGSQTVNPPELQTEKGDVFCESRSKEADSTSKMLRGEKDSTIQNGINSETPKLPPPKLQVDNKAENGYVDDSGNHMQASSENNRINSNDHFGAGLVNHEIVALKKVSIDKPTELEGMNGEPKSKKKKKNVDVHPSVKASTLDPRLNENQMGKPQPGAISSKGLVPSSNEGKPQPAGQSSKTLAPSSKENQKGKPQPGGKSRQSLALRSNENQREKRQPGGNSRNFEPASSFSDSRDEPIERAEISGAGARTMPSNKSDKLKPRRDEAKKGDATELSMGGYSKIDKEAGTASISSLESAKNTVSPYKNAREYQLDKKQNAAHDKKVPNTISGEVNSSQDGKKLMGISRAIFTSDISMPSADEDSSDSSDATTKTPSDYISSSDDSDVESSPEISSPQSGSSNLKRKKGGGKKSSKLRSSGMSLDAILRSSSRYKKAKLTASQSQLEDTESQPVDFVPESEPIY